MRYSPGTRLWACEASVSAGESLVIARDCVVASGLTRVRRERVASMRTLKRNLMGTVGPGTELLMEGLDSKRMAWAIAEPAINNMARAANEQTASRIL